MLATLNRASRPRPHLGASRRLCPIGLMLVVACGSGRPIPAVRDSAGVAVVTTAAEIADARPCPWVLGRKVQTISSADFYRLRGAVLTSDSTVVVLVGGTAQLEVYSLSGARLLAKTSRGEGPGELKSPGAVVRFAPDSVAVNDDANGRISVFDGRGRYVRSFRLPSGLVPSIVTPTALYGNLLIQPVSGFGFAARPGVHRDTMPLLMYSPAGAFRDTMAMVPDEEALVTRTATSMSVTTPVLPRYTEVAALDSSLIIGDNAKPQLVFVRDGHVTRIVNLMGLQQRMTRDIFEAAVQRAIRAESNPADRALFAAQYRSEPLPSVLPAFSQLLVGSDGEIWVRRYDPDPTALREWTILDATGALVCNVDDTLGLTVTDVERSLVAGIATDSNGVESVVLLSKEVQSAN